MFRIASMTKMVATVAALQLVERGKLDLDAPVEQYRPEFADLQVLDGFDGDEPRLRPPATQGDGAPADHPHQRASPTGSGTPTSCAGRQLTGTPNVLSGEDVTSSPRRWSPTRARSFEYGINTDWLGLVVEAAGGQTLDAYFAEHILGPLGMDADDVPDDRGAARELGARAPARRGRRVGGDRHRLVARSRSGGPAATACTRRRATT